MCDYVPPDVQHPLLQLRLIIPKERVEEDYSYGTPAPDPEYFGAGGLTARLMGLRFALVARKFAEMGVLVTETCVSLFSFLYSGLVVLGGLCFHPVSSPVCVLFGHFIFCTSFVCVCVCV